MSMLKKMCWKISMSYWNCFEKNFRFGGVLYIHTHIYTYCYTVILTEDCQPGHGFKTCHECILWRCICSSVCWYRKAPVIAFLADAPFLRSAQWIPEVFCIPSPSQARIYWICYLHKASDSSFHAGCDCREVVFIVTHVLKVGKHSTLVSYQ